MTKKRFGIWLLMLVLLPGCSEKEKGEPQLPGATGTATEAETTSVSIVGTSIRIPPPPGFLPAGRFSGFMKESTGSSIMGSEIDGPYAEVTAGFRDKRQMEAQGMTLLDHSPVRIEGQQAMLLNVEQLAYGTVFRKWMLAVERPVGTALLVATFPKAEADKEGERLKAALLATTFGKPGDPADALAFVVTPSAPFQVAKIMGQNMILSPGGSFPVENENIPFMVLGLSASEDYRVADQKAFAERRIIQIATVKDIAIDGTVAITIGGLPGYATSGQGVGESAATPLTVYQVLLFDESGYLLIQGVTPTTQKDKYLPVFEQIAATFEMKESQGR